MSVRLIEQKYKNEKGMAFDILKENVKCKRKRKQKFIKISVLWQLFGQTCSQKNVYRFVLYKSVKIDKIVKDTEWNFVFFLFREEF